MCGYHFQGNSEGGKRPKDVGLGGPERAKVTVLFLKHTKHVTGCLEYYVCGALDFYRFL